MSTESDENDDYDDFLIEKQKKNIYTNKNLEISVIGGLGVGKSTLICGYFTLLGDKFDEKFETIININDFYYGIKVFDTSGAHLFPLMIEIVTKNSEGFVLLFSINDRKSFLFLKDVQKKILEKNNGRQRPIILVGNKQDLNHERQVYVDEAEELANSWGCEYIEITLKTPDGVREIFEKLFKKIIEIKYPDDVKVKKKPCCCNII